MNPPELFGVPMYGGGGVGAQVQAGGVIKGVQAQQGGWQVTTHHLARSGKG